MSRMPNFSAVRNGEAMLPETVAVHERNRVFQWSYYYYDAMERCWLLYPAQSREDFLKATQSQNMTAAFRVVLMRMGHSRCGRRDHSRTRRVGWFGNPHTRMQLVPG